MSELAVKLDLGDTLSDKSSLSCGLVISAAGSAVRMSARCTAEASSSKQKAVCVACWVSFVRPIKMRPLGMVAKSTGKPQKTDWHGMLVRSRGCYGERSNAGKVKVG